MATNSTVSAKKRGPGRPFKKGQSGNPSGRPKNEIGEYIRSQDGVAQEIADFLLGIMRDKNASEGARIAAAKELSDRGWGKPTQQIESDSMDKFIEALNSRYK